MIGQRYGEAVEVLPRDDCERRSEEWHHTRRSVITATDVSALLNLNPYGETPFTVYWRKKQDLRVHADVQMQTGESWEDYVITKGFELYQAGGPAGTLHKPGFLTNVNDPWKGASCDALIFDADLGYRPLEAKVVSKWSGWGPDGSSEIPEHYRIQLLWQMIVIGANHGYLAALMPNHQTYLYEIDYDPIDGTFIATTAETFFHANLLGDVSPSITGESDEELALLKKIYVPVEEKRAEVSKRLVADLKHAREMATDYSKLAKRHEAQLRLLLADASLAVDETGKVLAKRTRNNRKGYTVADTVTDSISIQKAPFSGEAHQETREEIRDEDV